MLDVYDIWLYPLQDWYKTVNEMSDFMYKGQMENFIFCPVYPMRGSETNDYHSPSKFLSHNLSHKTKSI